MKKFEKFTFCLTAVSLTAAGTHVMTNAPDQPYFLGFFVFAALFLWLAVT